ncbi:MAG: hypothetical protein GX455_06730, partial [Phycisphaerae bacterium]|nr:hypothetical protein [Phycisphaerae bacterium]
MAGCHFEIVLMPFRNKNYLFVQDIIAQPESAPDSAAGWPTYNVNGQVINYGMDKEITESGTWKNEMVSAMTAIPSISIVTDLKHLFNSSTGIFVNAQQDGAAWERPCSMELIYPDGTEGFQINAGIRIRGGYSRDPGNPKHAFRMYFSGEYDGDLRYPLFGDEGADRFEKIDLACPQNYSWSFGGDTRNTFCRDVFSRDTQGAMGQPYSKTRYYHLYLDGTYWGIYYTDERTEDFFAETYLGGDELDYDVMKVAGSRGEDYTVYATNGDGSAYNRLWTAAKAGFSSDAAYFRIQGLNPDGTRNPEYELLLDEDNLIDYMICTYYVGDFDGPISNFLGNNRPNNFFAVYNRVTPDGWKFFRHDAEHSLFSGWDRTGPWPAGSEFNYFNPQWLHQQLTTNAHYRLRFADRVHRYFFNNGLLTPQASIDRWMNRANQIQTAIIGESARWGDSKTGYPLTKDHWLAEINSVKNNYFPGRTNEVLTQFKNKGWYPNQAAPVFGNNGGEVGTGYSLTMTGAAGTTTYYTLDGSDPRVFFVTDPAATVTLVAESAPKKVLVPTTDIGTTWRGGNEPFADSGWTAGTPIIPGKTGGIGYDTTGNYEPYISYNIQSLMLNKNGSAYFRIPFTVSATDLSKFQTLQMRIRYDDGYVAYINGTQVSKANAPTTPMWNSSATTSHSGSSWSTVDLTNSRSSLKAGNNILAVHGINRTNISTNRNDFLISVELTAVRSGTVAGGISPTAIPYTAPVVLTKSCQVKARTYSSGTWSALQEATFSVGSVGKDLRISEVMYHPNGDPNTEFVELYNAGTEILDLSLVRFDQGIDFPFGLTPATTTLAPNGYLVLARNPAAFAARYGAGIAVAGQYTGALDSNGERLRLVDALGVPIA